MPFCALKAASQRSLFFFARLLAVMKLKEPITRAIRLAGYRLCVYASGSVITVILSFSALISVSLLHLGQNSGKFISTVSLRSIIRVLPLQTGQVTQWENLLVFTIEFLDQFPISEVKS